MKPGRFISWPTKFANDIIQRFGGSGFAARTAASTSPPIAAARRTILAHEIWVMDWDGKNQKQLTHLQGADRLSLDFARRLAARLHTRMWPLSGDQRPRIGMVNSETGRTIPFYNQAASVNALANFTPDGAKIFYSSSASGSAQIYSADVSGANFTRVTFTRGTPSEPKVNPKNPNSVLFVDGQPNEQIYKMNSEGVGVERVTNGEGEASNPAWSPDGQNIAFAWTRGYQTGGFNIFVDHAGQVSQGQIHTKLGIAQRGQE